ncbi:MAG: hypothetical protein AB8G05_27665 [Oligoflexales bacterium]
MNKGIIYLLGLLLLVLVGISDKSRASKGGIQGRKRQSDISFEQKNKKAKIFPDGKKNSILRSKEFWESDYGILANVLSYIATPGDLMNVKVALIGGGLPRKSLQIFRKLNMVEIKNGNEILQKPLENLEAKDFANIQSFLNPELTAKYRLYKNPDLLREWDDEAITAAIENREPNYLNLLMELMEGRIKEFEEEKWNSILRLQTNEHGEKFQLQQVHFYSMLLSTFLVLDTAWDSAKSAAWDTFHPQDPANFSACNAATSSALNSAWESSEEATESVVLPESSKSARFVARSEAFIKARLLARSAVWAALDYSRKAHQYNPDLMGKIAYRIAEKTSLLYFIGHFDNWSEAIYSAVASRTLSEIKLKTKQDIFQEIEWKVFQQKHFSQNKIGRNVRIFVKPWLKVLDNRIEVNSRGE